MNFGWLGSGPAAPLGGCTDKSAWWKAARRIQSQDGCADPKTWRKAAGRIQRTGGGGTETQGK